jgi:hypothetical protein
MALPEIGHRGRERGKAAGGGMPDIFSCAGSGRTHIVQDDLEGPYNPCFEANEQKHCTYKP